MSHSVAPAPQGHPTGPGWRTAFFVVVVFWRCCEACRILVAPSGIEPRTTAVEVQALARQVGAFPIGLLLSAWPRLPPLPFLPHPDLSVLTLVTIQVFTSDTCLKSFLPFLSEHPSNVSTGVTSSSKKPFLLAHPSEVSASLCTLPEAWVPSAQTALIVRV